MAVTDTTVAVPRDLFERVKILAAREHRSARGQILQLLTIATAGIELPAPATPPVDRAEIERQRKADFDAMNRELDLIAAGQDI